MTCALFLGERMKAAGATGLALSIAGVAALTLLGVPPGSASAGAVVAHRSAVGRGRAFLSAGPGFPAAGRLARLPVGQTRPIGRRETRSIPMGFGGGACLPGQLRHAGSFRLLQLGAQPPTAGACFAVSQPHPGDRGAAGLGLVALLPPRHVNGIYPFASQRINGKTVREQR